MKDKQFAKLLAFLERLDQAKIPYSMQHSREDAVMIVAFAPGEYWEIEFLEAGDIDIERFRSNGHIDDESVLDELFALCSDDDVSLAQSGNQNDTSTGK
jgi:hypothetical protein